MYISIWLNEKNKKAKKIKKIWEFQFIFMANYNRG